MRRGGIIALVVFQSLWLNVILPGHTRGAITLPGYKADADKCCKHETPKQEAPSKDRASHCAVCFFAARLSMPVAIDIAPQELARCGQHEARSLKSSHRSNSSSPTSAALRQTSDTSVRSR